jgi:hypothetical protein
MTRPIGRAWYRWSWWLLGRSLFRGFAGFSAHTCPFRIPAPQIWPGGQGGCRSFAVLVTASERC